MAALAGFSLASALVFVPTNVTDRVTGHFPDDLQPRPAAEIPPYLNNHNMKGLQTLRDRG